MTQHEILQQLQNPNASTIAIAGKDEQAILRLDKSDSMAAQILEFALLEFDIVTMGELLDALDSARWWLMLMAALVGVRKIPREPEP